MSTFRSIRSVATTLALLASIVSDARAVTPRNVRIATYNVQQIPAPNDHDGHFFNPSGKPMTDGERIEDILANILASDYEIVALNEVFDEDTRKLIVQTLKGDFPNYVAYIGNDTDLQDSGLMLFSRHRFLPMTLDDDHIYECGDVEIGFGGIESDCPKDLLGFTEYHCDMRYASDPIWDQPDCYASKGAGIVQIELPFEEPLFVVFTHMGATYAYDDEKIVNAKVMDRRRDLTAIGKLVTDATEENAVFGPAGDLTEHYVVVTGDFNIDGNLSHPYDFYALEHEWTDDFVDGLWVTFASCADRPWADCVAEDRWMVDAWAFESSELDLGRTTDMPFNLDVTEPVLDGMGKRLDYMLIRGPTAGQPGRTDKKMIAQHPHIAWPLSGGDGHLSDHLPVGLDLLLPSRPPTHSTPRTAAVMTMAGPYDPNPDDLDMHIDSPGQMEWVRLDLPPGTYTIRDIGSHVAFDLYAPQDLSRPIAPHREAERNGFVYVLDQPPYYVRNFVARDDDDGERVHDRLATGPYKVTVERHRCTSPAQSCVLHAGAAGYGANWPILPVGPTDALWFEFLADDSDQKVPPFHDFVITQVSSLSIPQFGFTIRDLQQNPIPGVTQKVLLDTFEERQQRIDGLTGENGTFRSLLLELRRLDPNYAGQVEVAERTNLTYLVPGSIRIEQENDDSAHDELVLYTSIDPDPFYTTVDHTNVHEHASLFHALPQIDELEDGGQDFPLGPVIGQWRITSDFPVVLAEDDDEDGDVEEGDWMLANPDPMSSFATAKGHAIAPLDLDVSRAGVDWIWSDDPDAADPDDTSYMYGFTFRLSHVPPCKAWPDVPCKP